MADEDFDGFSDTVGTVTITPEEYHLILTAIKRDCPTGVWSPLMRIVYLNRVEKQLKERKAKDPRFVASTITINALERKVIIE